MMEDDDAEFIDSEDRPLLYPNPFSFRFCVLAAVCFSGERDCLQHGLLVIKDDDAVIIDSIVRQTFVVS